MYDDQHCAPSSAPMRRRGRCSALLRLSIACSLVACKSAVAVVHKQPGKPVDGRAVCNGSSWTGASAEQLLSGQVEPHVQCAREPPCVRWSWVRMGHGQTRVATLLALWQPQRVAARRCVTSHVASPAQTSFARCALLPLDADWPTWDPHLSSPPGEERSVTALAHALLRNSTLALLGDSINNLLGVAFECEAAKASNGGAEWSLVHEGAAVPFTLLSQEHALSARLAALKEYNTRFGRPQGSWWDAPLVNHAAGTVVVRKGYAKYNAVQLEQLLGVVDAVVINYGHHYAGVALANYTEDMRALFEQLDAWVRSGAASGIARTALFRETGAQHFAGTGAFRSWDQAHLQLGDTCACEPHADGAAHEDETTRMNAAVAALAEQYPLVRVVAFWEVTQPRYDMHEGAFCGFGNRKGPQPCCDCTHLCYTPQLWRTVFSDVWAAAQGQAEARRAAGLVRSGGHAVEAARLRAEGRVRERLDERAKERAKELKKERMQHMAKSLTPTPTPPPPAPRPTPPEQLFASASADDALAAAAAALAELAPAAPVAGLATVKASNASGETALEASSDAWFNKRPQQGSAPPSVQAGAAVLAAMHPQRAANVLATLEPELAGELLASMENGSAAAALQLLGKKLEELTATNATELRETGDLAR